MEPLVTTFELGNYCHTQLERAGDVAIFEQRHKQADMVRYEVIRVRVQKAYTWPNGTQTPEREAYPGYSVWGIYGFTAFTLVEAHTIAERLRREGTHGDGERLVEDQDAAPSTPC